ncbi:PKD domain-containing protein [Capnocytophaga canimorsus]|uniref:PKD domain-containing protein n=1 Tax=Capnocytophaga canimorsus TaxID=28188 RepID=UPI0037D10752
MIFSRIRYFCACFVLLLGCAVEQNIPIEGGFDILVVGERYNVPMRVRMLNKVQGADTFKWEFPGGSYTSSDGMHPEEIVYRQPGTHTITLHTSNVDGEQKTFQKHFTSFAELVGSFDWQQQGSLHAPLTLVMQNNSQGAEAYQWHFQGGSPEYSSEKNPTVVFNQEGEFTISLEVINHSQRERMEKNIRVNPPLEVAFDWKNEYFENYQAPVRIFLSNQTKNATLGYHWQVTSGISTQESTEENPSFLLAREGTYQITLIAKNDKQTLSLSKEIIVEKGDNLLTFKDIKLGVNTAQNTIGCFFSSYLGRILTAEEITPETGKLIDFVYFGQNSYFSYNVFLSPDKVQETVFEKIPGAIQSHFINKQENIGQTLLDSDGFDQLGSGSVVALIDIISHKNQAPFNKDLIPRIVLFQTSDERKGAIKIKEYISEGTQSYLLADIKIQKIP